MDAEGLLVVVWMLPLSLALLCRLTSGVVVVEGETGVLSIGAVVPWFDLLDRSFVTIAAGFCRLGISGGAS